MRRRRRLGLAAAVGLFVLLSGCGVLLGPDAGDAPGIEDGELADSEALFEAHVSELEATGYTYDVNLEQTRLEDGDPVEYTLQARSQVAPDRSRYLYQEIREEDVSSRAVVWGNESTEVRRIEVGGSDPAYQTGDPSDGAFLAGAPLLEPHLSAPFEVTSVDDREDGPAVVTLESTGRPTAEGAVPAAAGEVRTYRARLLVDTDGRILSLGVTVEYELDGETAGYDLTYEVTALEDPGIGRPPWVENRDDG